MSVVVSVQYFESVVNVERGWYWRAETSGTRIRGAWQGPYDTEEDARMAGISAQGVGSKLQTRVRES